MHSKAGCTAGQSPAVSCDHVLLLLLLLPPQRHRRRVAARRPLGAAAAVGSTLAAGVKLMGGGHAQAELRQQTQHMAVHSSTQVQHSDVYGICNLEASAAVNRQQSSHGIIAARTYLASECVNCHSR